MNSRPESFTHLHAHSSYSIGVGLSTPHELCAAAKQAGFGSLALTDINNTYGYLEFHAAAQEFGLKPIYGAVVYHTSILDPGRDRYPLTLLAKTRTGLKNVVKLTSLSATAFETGVALSVEQLTEMRRDVVVLTGSKNAELSRLVLENRLEDATALLQKLRDIFGDSLYVEIQDHGDDAEKQHAQRLARLSRRHEIDPVLTQEIRYARAELRQAYELLSGVRDPHHVKDFFAVETDDAIRHIRSADEMAKLQSVYPEAYENAGSIGELVAEDLLASMRFPHALHETTEQAVAAFRALCVQRLRTRYPNLVEPEQKRYDHILEREIKTIVEQDLIDTFLFFHKIFAKVRQLDIATGPATGLALQSLSAYLLDITTYDPYQNDHGFVPMLTRPTEIEIQLPSDVRETVVGVVKEAIGEKSVAYVPAIDHITAARAVRMVSAVVDITAEDEDAVLKIIARHPGESIRSLSEEERRLGRLYKQSIPVRELLNRASLLEGLPAGFIKSRRSLAVTGEDVSHFLAHLVDGESEDVFVHANRDSLASAAILRIDLTLITAMTMVREIEAALEKWRGITYGWEQLAAQDLGVWEDIQTSDPVGVFLFEGQTLQKHRGEMSIHSLVSLANFLALMRLHDEYTFAERLKAFNNKHELPADEPAAIRATLATTHGHILYLEQLRDIVVAITGLPENDAPRMLSAMQQSTPEALGRVRAAWMRGAADADIAVDAAERWLQTCLYFATRVVSRERVLADALLVCKLFFLRRYYPALYFTALLNSYAHNESRLKKYVSALRGKGLIAGLDVNRSDIDFTTDTGQVRLGFLMFPNIGAGVVDRIMRLRGRMGFHSLQDFVRRVGRTSLNRESVLALIKAGAFDRFNTPRDALIQTAKQMFKRPTKAARAADEGQMELPLDGSE